MREFVDRLSGDSGGGNAEIELALLCRQAGLRAYLGQCSKDFGANETLKRRQQSY
jgi:hypothetical protein